MGNQAGAWGCAGRLEPMRSLAGLDDAGGLMGLTKPNQLCFVLSW